MRLFTRSYIIFLATISCSKASTSPLKDQAEVTAEFKLTSDTWKSAVGLYRLDFPAEGSDAVYGSELRVYGPIKSYTAQLSKDGDLTLETAYYNGDSDLYVFKVNNSTGDQLKEWIRYAHTKSGLPRGAFENLGFARQKGKMSLARAADFSPISDWLLASLRTGMKVVAAKYPSAAYLQAMTDVKIGRIELIRDAFEIMNGRGFTDYDSSHLPELSFLNGGNRSYEDWSVLNLQMLNSAGLAELPAELTNYKLSIDNDHTLKINWDSVGASGQAEYDLGIGDFHFGSHSQGNPLAMAARAIKGILFGRGANRSSLYGQIQFKNGLDRIIKNSYVTSDSPEAAASAFLEKISQSVVASLPQEDIESASLISMQVRNDTETTNRPQEDASAVEGPEHAGGSDPGSDSSDPEATSRVRR